MVFNRRTISLTFFLILSVAAARIFAEVKLEDTAVMNSQIRGELTPAGKVRVINDLLQRAARSRTQDSASAIVWLTQMKASECARSTMLCSEINPFFASPCEAPISGDSEKGRAIKEWYYKEVGFLSNPALLKLVKRAIACPALLTSNQLQALTPLAIHAAQSSEKGLDVLLEWLQKHRRVSPAAELDTQIILADTLDGVYSTQPVNVSNIHKIIRNFLGSSQISAKGKIAEHPEKWLPSLVRAATFVGSSKYIVNIYDRLGAPASNSEGDLALLKSTAGFCDALRTLGRLQDCQKLIARYREKLSVGEFQRQSVYNLMEAGDFSAAAKILADFKSALATNAEGNMWFNLDLAEVKLGGGKSQEALELSKQVLDEATTKGIKNVQIYARLAVARAERAMGNFPAATRTLNIQVHEIETAFTGPSRLKMAVLFEQMNIDWATAMSSDGLLSFKKHLAEWNKGLAMVTAFEIENSIVQEINRQVTHPPQTQPMKSFEEIKKTRGVLYADLNRMIALIQKGKK